MKTHYSCAELARLKLPDFPATERALRDLVDRESWSFIEEKSRGRGGLKRLYAPPQAVLNAIRKQEQAIAAVENPGALQKVMRHAMQALRDIESDQAAQTKARQERAEAFLREATGLSDHEALSLKAHCEIAEGWQVWFVKHQPMKRSHSWAPYTHAYNMAEIPVSKAVREAYPDVSARSVQRWVTEYERGNLAALVDHRNGSDKKGKNIFTVTPLLAAYAKNIMLQRPGISCEDLKKLLETASVDEQTGETLFKAPTYHQAWRFQKSWIEENHDLYLQATNPDAFKNSVMLAFGSYSADIVRLNQRWEMDATPADWLLLDSDGKKIRYTVSAIIDVFSRRAIVVVSRTPKTTTHCIALRQALLAWGVPAMIVTDNGADYQSEHFKRVLKSLGIEHKTTLPFSPEEKPHVERFIGTLNHSILELLPNFAGHSVADRKAIEARRSFAERLAKRGELVDFADVIDGSCSGERLQERINTWLAGSYEHNEHGGLGKNMTPFMRATAWTGEIRRIGNERSLDLLLARPAGNNGRRTLQKKGINLDGTWFIAPELAALEMGSVLDIYETSDLGKVIVYFRNNFVCIAQAPERTGVDRAAIAAAADAIQKERLKESRRRIKAETKALPSTDEVLERHLNDRAVAAGKLVQGNFAAQQHTSHGLEQAARAVKAMDVPQPSSRATELQALAAKAMADAPINVTPLPAARAHATPLEGMSMRERFALHGQYAALVGAHGGDVEVLAEPWQRRFYLNFPETPGYKAEAAMAAAQKETRGG